MGSVLIQVRVDVGDMNMDEVTRALDKRLKGVKVIHKSVVHYNLEADKNLVDPLRGYAGSLIVG